MFPWKLPLTSKEINLLPSISMEVNLTLLTATNVAMDVSLLP